MIVLSLFDGMSCGRIAFERAEINIEKYYASEIEEGAIKVAMKNHPEIIQLGDVRTVKGVELPKIDLLLGGSPCNDLSLQNKDRSGLKGDLSSLFYEYYRLLQETNPKYFLLENVFGVIAILVLISGIIGTSIYMNKNVLIIKGSPRTKGNTATMADIFAKGAIEKQ